MLNFEGKGVGRAYGRAHVWILVWLVKDVVLTTDRGIVDIAVGSDGGGEADGR
jgi:hypothetical protein